MWFLWKLLCSITNSEETYQNKSWKTKKSQMWFLWQILYSIRKSQDAYQDNSLTKNKTQMWFLWKILHSNSKSKNHIMAIHEEQRNYKCDSCGNSFTQSQNLKRHIKRLYLLIRTQRICKQKTRVQGVFSRWSFSNFVFLNFHGISLNFL